MFKVKNNANGFLFKEVYQQLSSLYTHKENDWMLSLTYF